MSEQGPGQPAPDPQVFFPWTPPEVDHPEPAPPVEDKPFVPEYVPPPPNNPVDAAPQTQPA